MALLMLAFLVGITVVTGIVLADSGLRMWSAFGGIARQQAMLRNNAGLPTQRRVPPARVVTRVSYSRCGTATRAAA